MSLKKDNERPLAAIFVINAVVFQYSWFGLPENDLRSIITYASGLAACCLIGPIVVLVNNVIPSGLKEKIVFLRNKNELASYRAFDLAQRDRRIDPTAIHQMYGGAPPVDPVTQNGEWQRLYRMTQNAPSVVDAHRARLLLRDWLSMSILVLILCHLIALFYFSAQFWNWSYSAFCLLQIVAVRYAAVFASERMVTNVVAISLPNVDRSKS